MAETLKNQLIVILSEKLPGIVSETVKDNVKLTLNSSFRHAFEASLLPAFQVYICIYEVYEYMSCVYIISLSGMRYMRYMILVSNYTIYD